MKLHGLAAGVTATFVTALVSMDCMIAFYQVVGIYSIVQFRLPYATRPRMGTESRSRCRSWITNRPHGGRTLPFFVAKKLFECSDLITVNMWVVTCFVIEVFSRRSWSLTDGGLALVARDANLNHRDRVRLQSPSKGTIGNRRPLLNTMERTVLEKGSITDENANRSYLSGNLAGENVVVSMTKLLFCYTGLIIVSP